MFAFNRTSVELKPCNPSWDRWKHVPFNRTSVELKLLNVMWSPFITPLLIEPVWNWNTSTDLKVRIYRSSFNRTSVELKHIVLCLMDAYFWPFNRTIVELKPWGHAAINWLAVTFNRTIVELKLPSIAVDVRFDLLLLIEPVWNWNTAHLIFSAAFLRAF